MISREVESRWWIVAACMLGQIVSQGPVVTFGFAAFVQPVTEELGFARSTFASGLLVSNLVSAGSTLFVGPLIDRFGARAVLVLGIPLFATSVACLALLGPSVAELYTLFALAGLFAAAQANVAYAKVISRWFDKDRGLALGIAMAGIGLGVAIVPFVADHIARVEGWRAAYISVALLIFMLGFVPALLVLREPQSAKATGGSEFALEGVSAGEALRTAKFWIIAVGFFAAVSATNGTLAHFPVLLRDRGIDASAAAFALSFAGISMVIGRILCGWCLDRYPGPLVAAGFFVVPALGILILPYQGLSVAYVSALLCGLGVGAHVGVMAVFAGRYFGLRSYGTIFGLMFALFLAGNGVGPFLAGASYDFFGSYTPGLLGFAAALLALCVIFLGIGPYPYGAPPSNSGAKKQLSAGDRRTHTPEGGLSTV